MRHRYLPTTQRDREEMLREIGVSSVEELFTDIPEEVRFQGELPIPKALSEPELLKHMKQLVDKNLSTDQFISFLGAGVYEHHIPSVVQHVISRSEFYTAYTPYQPEISQGELQAMFEFQTMICELTGMDVANSSMYDGSTAVAEAANLAVSGTDRKKLLISQALHPEAKQILQTYAKGRDWQVIEIPCKDGRTHLEQLQQQVDQKTAAVIIQSPNFLGVLEDLEKASSIAHAVQSLLVVSANPLSLGILKPPGEFGADVVVGDVQPLGIPLSFGGPHCGFFATTKKWMRRMPGRLVGQTVDREGRRGYVLTLQAREQHIRRDKATSNICSNQALNALAATVYLSAMGKRGIYQVAYLNMQKAYYAKQRLLQVPGVSNVFSSPFFNEFVIRLSAPVREVNEALLQKGILGGFDLEQVDSSYQRMMLVAVTELRSKAEIDRLANALEEIL